MADITLTVDVSSLNKASKALDAFGASVRKNSTIVGLSRGINTLQNNIRELVTAQQKGTIGGSAYQLGLLQVKRAYEQMGLSSQAATAAVRRYAAELQKQDAARAAEQAAKALALAQQQAAAAAKVLADRQLDLRRRFQEGYALFERQRQAMRDLREAYRANIITLQQYQAQLAQIRAGNLGGHINQQASAMGRFGLITQQAGYQFGDFFVQIQSGTNFLVAFGQQATQLVGTFAGLATSVKAIAIFSGLGILISLGTAIGAAMMRASGSTKTLKDRVSELSTASSDLKANFDSLKNSDVETKFGNLNTEIKSLTSNMLLLNSASELDLLTKTLDKVKEAATAGWFDRAVASYTGFYTPDVSMQEDMAAVDEEQYKKLGFSMDRKPFLDAVDAMRAEALSGNREGVVKLFDAFVKDATDAGASVGQITEAGRLLALQLYQVNLSIAESSALFNGSADAAARLIEDAKRQAEAEKQKLEYIKESALQYYQNLQDQKTLNDERESAVNAIISSRDEELRKLSQESELLQKINAFGKDSAEVKAYEADIARQAYAQELLRQGILGNNFKLVMEEYDALVLVQDQFKENEKITKLLEQGLSLSTIEAMKLAGVDFTKLSQAALAAGVLATNLGVSFGLASEIGKISAMSESDRKIYTGVKSGLLPEAALNSIGLGPNGFTRDGSFPINIPGMMPDNPTTSSTGNEGGTGPAEATQTAIEKLQEQLAVERELIGTSEAYQKVRQALGEEFSTTSPQVIAGLVQEATETQRLIDLDNQRISLLGTVKSAMEDTLMSIVDGTKSAKDAFKTMAAEIIKELYRVYVVQQLVNSVSGFFAPSSGVPGRAAGGSMMANTAYMVGEKGPELVIPRHSGTVVNAKQTANAIGGGGSITVQNNITVTGSDAAMVRTEVAKMIPQITNATKAAVLDAKQRGGQFAAAFR